MNLKSGYKKPSESDSKFLKAGGAEDSTTYATSSALNGYATYLRIEDAGAFAANNSYPSIVQVYTTTTVSSANSPFISSNSDFGALTGNQALVLQLNAGANYKGQLAFGFGSEAKLLYRNRASSSTWSDWKGLMAKSAETATTANTALNSNALENWTLDYFYKSLYNSRWYIKAIGQGATVTEGADSNSGGWFTLLTVSLKNSILYSGCTILGDIAIHTNNHGVDLIAPYKFQVTFNMDSADSSTIKTDAARLFLPRRIISLSQSNSTYNNIRIVQIAEKSWVLQVHCIQHNRGIMRFTVYLSSSGNLNFEIKSALSPSDDYSTYSGGTSNISPGSYPTIIYPKDAEVLFEDSWYALLSDFNTLNSAISNLVTLNTDQTITGAKTFSATTTFNNAVVFNEYVSLFNNKSILHSPRGTAGGAMLFHDGAKTIVGSIDSETTSATVIRSITGHIKAGSSAPWNDVYDTGNIYNLLYDKYFLIRTGYIGKPSNNSNTYYVKIASLDVARNSTSDACNVQYGATMAVQTRGTYGFITMYLNLNYYKTTGLASGSNPFEYIDVWVNASIPKDCVIITGTFILDSDNYYTNRIYDVYVRADYYSRNSFKWLTLSPDATNGGWTLLPKTTILSETVMTISNNTPTIIVKDVKPTNIANIHYTPTTDESLLLSTTKAIQLVSGTDDLNTLNKYGNYYSTGGTITNAPNIAGNFSLWNVHTKDNGTSWYGNLILLHHDSRMFIRNHSESSGAAFSSWYEFITDKNAKSKLETYLTNGVDSNIKLDNIGNTISFYDSTGSSPALIGSMYSTSSGVIITGPNSNTLSLQNEITTGSSFISVARFSSRVLAPAMYLTSDVRKKTITDFPTYTAELIAKLMLVKYLWKDNPDRLCLGSIAQSVETLYPELINQNSEGYKSVNYSVLGTVSAIALAREIVELKKRIKLLEDGIVNSYLG